jgi:hypothetical protein
MAARGRFAMAGRLIVLMFLLQHFLKSNYSMVCSVNRPFMISCAMRTRMVGPPSVIS